ncbi:RluA family pseudouridine synthase [Acidiferrobacter thiooxydans]|jgi:23S rRNA pseudouridine955/2504/2580 synthase|uniref:Pseudouridine synthase n=1 Tax=Acidiferrobacter thiooxydans TaxID=163359 RepID=A0A368HFF8_9GAMM|nr:RluA family pseudouridine synthase [Acidiferrobacter thiooxydans]MDA8189885.1 RluA family pseudouridine synthase [Gammaproteobacteria bacterium]RCN57175.1 23S rRNA pseudouridine(955/2504/2580) synthase [Acidiferrobacter thiooxydans]
MSWHDKAASAVRLVTIDAERSGQRLDNFLLAVLKGVPRTHIYRIVRKGEIRINKGRRKADYRLQVGDVVRIPPIDVKAPPPPAPDLAWLADLILFEDDWLLVLDKPSGMAVHGGSGLSFGVIEALRALRPAARGLELVHRLDRATSGCLLIAKRRSALRGLHESLRSGHFGKHYVALLQGVWVGGARTVDAPLLRRETGERRVVVDAAGKPAQTHFTPRRRFRDATLTDVRLGTGRTHQVRVHAAYLGNPVAGDERYGDPKAAGAWKQRGLARLFLHAARLSFPHPATGQTVDIESPLPKDLVRVLESLDG